MNKKFLGIICIFYSGIIIYVWVTGLLKNFLAPNMQLYLKISIIPLLLMGLVIIFNSKSNYQFKISDLILLLPLLMIFIAQDGRLTESLSSNRTSFNRENSIKSSEIIEDEKIKKEAEEEEEKIEYDLSNPYFNITDEVYNELANYISYAQKAEKFEGKTIKVTGFIQKYASYIPEGYATIGKYSISCCAADASFIGFFFKYDTSKIKSYKWYEIEGILKKGKDNDGYDILYIDVVNINEIDSKGEEQYIYPCYNYGEKYCKSLEKYDLEY